MATRGKAANSGEQMHTTFRFSALYTKLKFPLGENLHNVQKMGCLIHFSTLHEQRGCQLEKPLHTVKHIWLFHPFSCPVFKVRVSAKESHNALKKKGILASFLCFEFESMDVS